MATPQATLYPLGLRTPFRKAASFSLDSAIAEIDANWQGALSGDDPDAVHDLRVGTRRLRAGLSVYEGVLPAKRFQAANNAVAELTDILGPARDADVLIEHLESVVKRYSADSSVDAIGINALIKDVRKTRKAEQKNLDKALKKFNIDQLKADLNSQTEAG